MMFVMLFNLSGLKMDFLFVLLPLLLSKFFEEKFKDGIDFQIKLLLCKEEIHHQEGIKGCSVKQIRNFRMLVQLC